MTTSPKDIDRSRDLFQDLAGSHPSTAGDHERVDPAVTAADLAALARDGYVILEDLVGEEELAAIRAGLEPHLERRGRNSFEGRFTQRVYAVMGKTDACDGFLEHPRVLCALDELLLPNYLLSMCQGIKILPGETRQPLHHDDNLYPIPRPRAAFSVATILAVDDFTAENGATVIVPGSHAWDDREPGPDDPVVPVVMPAGSAVLFLGTLWHGGGANTSGATRLALTAQYCEPWARTQENMFLAVPRERARRASPNLQRMLGYSIGYPFMGQVGGMSPLRCLDPDAGED